MAVQTDRIERDILISAPVERVWELISDGEHVGRWFADAGAQIDLQPGGAVALTWSSNGTVRGRVEAVEPPRRLAYRWLAAFNTEEEATPANSTLIEFTLTEEGDGTRVAVVESGFDALEMEQEKRSAMFADHIGGWKAELGDLGEYATETTR